MTKDDFYIIRNSITMRQVAESYGFYPNKKGFIPCPFHGGGDERTPSLKVYDGYRGFYCHACHEGGDVIRFVELMNNLKPTEAVKELSEVFNVLLSDTNEIPEETRQRANKARQEYEYRMLSEQQQRAELSQINTLITAYRNIMEEENRMSETYVYCYNRCQYLIYRQELLSLEVYGKK